VQSGVGQFDTGGETGTRLAIFCRLAQGIDSALTAPMARRGAFTCALLLAGCGDGTGGAGLVDWTIVLDGADATAPLPAALLGQYDLSGALFDYAARPDLVTAMGVAGPARMLPGDDGHGVGLSEWRVGVGLALPGQLLLPTLSDGSSCADALAGFPPQAFAPAGTSELDLLRQRDWFIDDGAPVSEATTADDGRYQLGYVRRVIDTALSFGATPWVDIDFMPRALSVNRTPMRSTATLPDACQWPLSNAISNARPADAGIFAAAAAGLVRRIVEGSGGEPGRAVRYWELWNEPELPWFWDPHFENGTLDRFYEMAIRTLFALAGYRDATTHPAGHEIRLGLGSFASADLAAATLRALDQNPVAGQRVPLDFISFHSYHDDPLAIVADIRAVAAARAQTRDDREVELALAEWGPALEGSSARGPASMDFPLLCATVVTLGAAAGLTHAHQSLFWAYYPQLDDVYGLLDNALAAKPLYWAYALMARLFAGGDAVRLRPSDSGELDGGMGAVLAARDASGRVRVLLVNRNPVPRTARIELDGSARVPARVLGMDDVHLSPVALPVDAVLTLPARSLVLVEL
jgi:hypothetical protein